jgi:hypothetical protein
MKIQLDMLESDIIRAIKNTEYSPLQLLAARHFKDLPANIDAGYDSIVIWNDEINDYHSYKYCPEYIESIKLFLDEWHDFVDDNISDFCSNAFSFCIEPKR